MNTSDIPTEIFAEAHAEALQLTSEEDREAYLSDNIAISLVDRLMEQGRIENAEEALRIRRKINHAIRSIQDKRGLEYLTEPVNRGGFRDAFFHQIALRMSLADMPESVKKKSGEFRLNLPKDIK